MYKMQCNLNDIEDDIEDEFHFVLVCADYYYLACW